MDNIHEAICVLQNSEITGNIIFKMNYSTNIMKISLDLKNVPSGYHGFHIHESGDLREGCKSLCKHFNPYNKHHGSRTSKIRHLGDLGNIIPDINGNVKKIFYDKHLKLKGRNSILGRSVIIHEDRDDLGKGNNAESLITGNAGKRIACGVIGISKNCF